MTGCPHRQAAALGDRIEGARIDGQTPISRSKRGLGRFSGEPPADPIGWHSPYPSSSCY
jgi:hypothetical protein